jgi:hypothetical protein
MAQDFLTPATRVEELETDGESAMKASLAEGLPHGYEVGFRYFTINGRMLGHGEPVRVKQGERVLFRQRRRCFSGHTLQGRLRCAVQEIGGTSAILWVSGEAARLPVATWMMLFRTA